MLVTAITRADQLFADLRNRVVEGEIPAASKLSEPELAKHYQVSRSTLRDALSRLEGCRLLERKPNVGYRVVSLSVEQLLEVFYLRESLEGMACRLAAQNIQPSQLQKLDALLSRHASDDQIRSGEAYIQAEHDWDFHFCIVQASGNQMLIKLLCEELYYLVRMYRYQFGMQGARVKRALGEHSHIVQAIRDGDGELAEILMRRHIAASRQNLERRLAAEQSIQQEA